ncbi:MAG: hypothetical protein WC840_01055 [Candidatus Peribacteraceae bacterium]
MPRFISFLGLILLAGCSRPQSIATAPQAPASQSGMVSSIAATATARQPVYTLFSPRLVGKGESVLLFFAQAADPFSSQSDRTLQTVYASGSALLSTYRLDYGSSTGARFTYGVIVPDTFVLLSPDGARKTNVIHPSETELRTLLGPSRQ